MKRLVLVLLIATAVLGAKRLTPATRLPNSFDDMIYNNLRLSDTGNFDSGKITHVSSEPIQFGDMKAAMEFLVPLVGGMHSDNVNEIFKSFSTIEEGRVESHYVFNAQARASFFNYWLVNIVREFSKVTIVVSSDKQQAFGIQTNAFYHDVKKSALGLPFETHEVLMSENSEASEFHEFNRQRLMAEIKQVRGSQSTGTLGFDVAAVVGQMTDVVKKLTESWKDIVAAFKTIKKDEFKQKLDLPPTFHQFSSTSRFIRSIGIPMNYWSTYKKTYLSLTGLDKNPIHKSSAEALLEMATFIPENTWSLQELTFGLDVGGTCNGFVAMTKRDYNTNSVSLSTVVADGSFKLSPDVFLWTKYSSVAGGIVEKTKDYFRNVPRGITADEVKAINALVLTNAISVMSEKFGVKFEIPDDPLK